MSECCILFLLMKPAGWGGHATWCRCGTLLILRDGEWRSSDSVRHK